MQRLGSKPGRGACERFEIHFPEVECRSISIVQHRIRLNTVRHHDKRGLVQTLCLLQFRSIPRNQVGLQQSLVRIQQQLCMRNPARIVPGSTFRQFVTSSRCCDGKRPTSKWCRPPTEPRTLNCSLNEGHWSGIQSGLRCTVSVSECREFIAASSSFKAESAAVQSRLLVDQVLCLRRFF